jgi:uncharacterized coiled-coil DUF342 family protein
LSKEQKAKEIEILSQKISQLKEQRDKIDARARVHADNRDKLNDQTKSLRVEIAELKSERDKLNEEVRNLKLLRGELKERIQERIEEIKQIRERSKELIEKRPSRSHQSLQKEINDIDWKIQTTHLSLEAERELVEQVKHLEAQLNVHRKLEQVNQKIHELMAEIEATKVKGMQFHERLTETARHSQEIHQKMLGRVEVSKKHKEEADSLHQLFLQAREEVKPIQKEIGELSDRLRQLKLEIRSEEKLEKKMGEKALREEFGARAREKLKRGERLTWEEFSLLDDDETAAQG